MSCCTNSTINTFPLCFKRFPDKWKIIISTLEIKVLSLHLIYHYIHWLYKIKTKLRLLFVNVTTLKHYENPTIRTNIRKSSIIFNPLTPELFTFYFLTIQKGCHKTLFGVSTILCTLFKPIISKNQENIPKL